MLLETEPSMSDQSRINHIVVGLPLNIQDRLDKETINTTEQLMNQLRRYTSIFPRLKKSEGRFLSATNKTDRLNENRNQKSIEKLPCSYCEARGYTGCFHPVDYCRYKIRSTDARRVNLTDVSEVAVNAQEEEQQKN
uniref:Uncharacterized protein LOC114327586 n=1 Tax=Diabrotica virgifera virgifera TaxID=50390 RepID=A0A6P7F929_DIAVI